MKLYSGRVRLAGEIKNEVNKYNLTASEILVLKAIHGASENASDPVVEIKETGSVNRSDSKERSRLAGIYSTFRGQDGATLVNKLLGVAGVPLPQEYVPEVQAIEDEFDVEDVEEEPEVIVEAEKPKPITRTRMSFKDKVKADAEEAEAA
jgi:hypothetical protein